MYAMRPAHHRRVFVSQRFFAENLDKVDDVFFQNLIRLLQQVAQRRVDDIGRGQPVVNPFAFRPQAFRDGPGKSDYVMARFLLDLVDPVDVEGGVFPQQRDIFFRNNSEFRPGFARANFNLQPSFKLVLLGPDGPHFRSAVTFDHN
ncbi:hypothetical protein D1872_285790 [compost metagenome]